MSIDPTFESALGLYRSGRLAQAESLLRELSGRERRFEYLNVLGAVLAGQGKLQDAVATFQRAVEIDPQSAIAAYNLGNALSALGQFDEAIEIYHRSTQLDPQSAPTWNNLGSALNSASRFDDAIEAYQRAVALRADFPQAAESLGSLLRDTGRLDEAISYYDRVLSIRPDARLASARVYALLFHEDWSSSRLLQEHLNWASRYAPDRPLTRHDNDPSPDRRLRIGYVSPDFRQHVIGYNLLPLVREHDRSQVRIFCYSNVRTPDALTERFRRLSDEWREIQSLDDDAAEALIRRDRIDILIDTTLHMPDNRLLLFARKPAPVQATFAGYPGTTGLGAIDYRLTDPFLDPSDQSDEDRYTEKSIQLRDSFWCFQPEDDQRLVNELPALRNGFVTFGCLNAFAKMSPVVMQLWAQILRSRKDSKLALLAPTGSARQRVLASMAGQGIDPGRIIFFDRQPRPAYLALYDQIDLVLDTFPYNGHSTTLDALWMGVPVVTLWGDPVVSRGGRSILSNLQLQELIAETQQGYAKTASDLAANPPRLQELRGTLRERMKRSPLMDASRFARNVEDALRQMWYHWCTNRGQ